MNITLESYVSKITIGDSPITEPKFESVIVASHVSPIGSNVTYTTNAKAESITLESHTGAIGSSISISKKKSADVQSHVRYITSSAKTHLEDLNIRLVKLTSFVTSSNVITEVSPYHFPVTYQAHVSHMENLSNSYHVENPTLLEVQE